MNRSTWTTTHASTAAALGLVLVGGTVACERGVDAMTPNRIEQHYGVSGVYSEDVLTADGAIKGSIVPVTLADGRQAQLFIPQRRNDAPERLYIRDEDGLHPVRVSQQASREEVTRAPAVIERRVVTPAKKKRSWEKEALIIGGSAGAGALIGGVASGKKGAAIGATAGGIGGLIYDIATRDK